MLSPIYFPHITYGVILKNNSCNCNSIQSWLAFGRLPENPIITPNKTTQLVSPSALNKYLESVTVNPIPTTPTPTPTEG